MNHHDVGFWLLWVFLYSLIHGLCLVFCCLTPAASKDLSSSYFWGFFCISLNSVLQFSFVVVSQALLCVYWLLYLVSYFESVIPCVLCVYLLPCIFLLSYLSVVILSDFLPKLLLLLRFHYLHPFIFKNS